MNFRKHRRPHAAVEASSLSDILFFLLLFFLIISTLASPNAIKLLLPKASTGQTISHHAINVSISANLSYYIDKRMVSLETLEPELQRESKNYENPTVVLRVDKSVTVEELVKVVDIVNRLRIPLVIATDKSK
ncbi:biopolymer transport protein ExbD [Flexibacter flexilis DSM 6793]|uniref:Biopolymer transport protein ExbD n=1 Tax=Flexibacter flexilis DSM 6793 TaxID=927664 RepID=A0A1I1EA76_9BACT|nr:biopolymer transporter ExbD [Flexibacter flexilis]SFB84024.1 biopolymer transport protein ExbD [Flexibacter flexilis DSM 6793]